jgi:hypothetical protein
MSEGRLSASIEATGLIRRTEAAGDFAAVLRKGDPDRGALLIVVRRRGSYIACLERRLAPDGRYQWARTGPADSEIEEEIAEFLKKRISFDQDLWLIELDIAEPEQFIAETTFDA